MDNAPDPGSGGSLQDVTRPLVVHAAEGQVPTFAHDGHQVKYGVDSLAGPGQGVWTQDVALYHLHVVRGEHGAAGCNRVVSQTTRPLICHLDAGVEVTTAEDLDTLLAVMHDHDADIVGPRVVKKGDSPHTVSEPSFDERGRPVLAPGPSDHRSDGVRTAPWLPTSAVLIRREVSNAVGGFDTSYGDDLLVAADFSLKAQQRDFSCLYATGVTVVDHADSGSGQSDGDLERFRERWADAVELPAPLGHGHARSQSAVDQS